MAFFRKKKKKGDEKGEATKHFRRGNLPCRKCGTLAPLEGQKPLSITQCPSCGEYGLVPMRVAGYWLFALLGAGGMGAAYKAYHEDKGDTLFAVKILPRGSRDNSDFIRNLQSEAEISEKLSGHPCLVNYVGSGVDNGEHYLVTEFLEGIRLDLHIENVGKLPVNEVLFIGLRLIAAETHIYNRGYLHRDLKPGNIILSSEHGVVLYDYGICMPLADALHVEDDYCEGTPAYLPPERVLGEGEQANSEIYSLGMLLYHAAAGHSFIDPYISYEELKALVVSRRNQARKGLQLKEIASDELSAVIGKMIERQAPNRYQTMVEVERDLLAILLYNFRSNEYGRLAGL